MLRFAANLNMLYPELPFLDRFAACAADGFRGVEVLFPYDVPEQELIAALRANNLEPVLFNVPAGDWAAGERGFAALPGREGEFRASIDQALALASKAGCRQIHVLSGVAPGSSMAHHEHFDTLCANMAHAAPLAAREGVTLLLEPINRRDMPGYLLNTQAQAFRVVQRVGAPNLRMQMDLYHCQVTEGDLSTKIRQYLPHIGHFQVAGVPQRHEPDMGEVHYPYLFDLIESLGYAGWIGCEYRPSRQGPNATSAGLDWLRALRDAGRC